MYRASEKSVTGLPLHPYVRKAEAAPSRKRLPLLMSVITAQKILRIVLQTGKGVDTAGSRLDLLSSIVGERVEVVFRLRLTAEQSVQVGIVHSLSPRQ